MNGLNGKQWILFTGLGLLCVLLGAAAWVDAITVTLASTMFLGILVMIGGVAQIVHAFAVRAWSGFLVSLAAGFIYVLGGALLIREPETGSVFITVILAFCLVVAGVMRIITALRVRGLPGWWIILAGGLVSLAVGILLYATLPWSGLWLVGSLIAIELIVTGIGWIQFGLALRRSSDTFL